MTLAVLLGAGEVDFSQRFADSAILGTAIVAAISCGRAARRPGPDARGWKLLCISVSVWGSGELILTLGGFLGHGFSGFSPLAGIGFLAYSVPAVAALLAFQRGQVRFLSTLRGLVDALVIALSIVFSSWVLVMGPVFRAGTGSWLLAAGGLVYPIIDSALMALLFVLAMRQPSGARLPWALLASGLLLIAVTDGAFLTLSVRGPMSQIQSEVGLGWMAAMLLIAIAPLAPAKPKAPAQQTIRTYSQRLTPAQELVPYIPVAVALAAALTVYNLDDPFLIAGSAAIFAVLTVRQIMIIREKDALHRELEGTVQAQTDELRLAETTIQQTYQNAPIGVFWVDMSGSLVQVNAALCEMVGRTRNELIGSNFALIKFPADISYGLKMLSEAAAATAEFHLSHLLVRYRHSDGREIWTELSSFLTRDSAGAPQYLIAQIQDVTERRSAARAQANQAAFLEAVLENLGAGVVACDAEGRVILFNRACREFFGASVPAMDPQDWVAHYRQYQESGITSPQTLNYPVYRADGVTLLPTEEMPLVRALSGQEVHDAEIVLIRENGDHRTLMANGHAINDADGILLGAVVTLDDITARRKAEAALSRQLLHDPLTDLANRALLRDRLEHAIARQSRRPDPLALILLDLDRFKLVNDSLGHHAGDQLLVSLAVRLRTCLRPDDTIARLGGDEFAVVLENTTEAQATLIAEQILAEVRRPFTIDGRSISTDASIGIMISTDSDSPESLLRNADLAMYAAKDSGKGNVQVFKAAMHETVLKRLVLDAELREAITKQQFALCYQPIVSLVTGSLQGFEALLRWNHPERGVIAPSTFIPLAETTGLIVPLGRWVLREACRQAGIWRKTIAGARDLQMSVNLSVRQLQDPAIVAEVASALAGTGLPPRQLHLEITESVFDIRGQISGILDQLHATGVQLVVDDFGTGYSSLSRLHSLPIDKVKIDKSFIDLLAGGGPAPMVAATIAMAHSLGLQTVAEGVESADQLPFLLLHHCDNVQGFLFGRPSGAAEIGDLLRLRGAGTMWTALSPVGGASL